MTPETDLVELAISLEKVRTAKHSLGTLVGYIVLPAMHRTAFDAICELEDEYERLIHGMIHAASA
jgi:hypothetical protein